MPVGGSRIASRLRRGAWALHRPELARAGPWRRLGVAGLRTHARASFVVRRACSHRVIVVDAGCSSIDWVATAPLAKLRPACGSSAVQSKAPRARSLGG
jgi:hypothetical protein